MNYQLITAIGLLSLSTLISIPFLHKADQEQLYLNARIKKQIAGTELNPTLDALIAYQNQIIEPAPAVDYPEKEVYEIIYYREEPKPVVVTAEEIYEPYRCGCAPAPFDPILIREYIEDEIDTTSILPEPLYIDPYFFEARAYPNPAQNFTSVELNIERDEYFEIKIYNMNGQLVEFIYNGTLFAGREKFEVDLQYLTAGLYFIQIVSKTQTETLKVQKV